MDWLIHLLPMGKVRPDPPIAGRKQMYRFVMYGSFALLQVMQGVRPYAIIKGREMDDFISRLTSVLSRFGLHDVYETQQSV